MVYIAEEVIEKYKPLLKSFVALQPFYNEEENLKQLFSILERAPKQLNALLAYLKLSKRQNYNFKATTTRGKCLWYCSP
ncbi:hypothetical protein [Pedobacter steynii]